MSGSCMACHASRSREEMDWNPDGLCDTCAGMRQDGIDPDDPLDDEDDRPPPAVWGTSVAAYWSNQFRRGPILATVPGIMLGRGRG